MHSAFIRGATVSYGNHVLCFRTTVIEQLQSNKLTCKFGFMYFIFQKRCWRIFFTKRTCLYFALSLWFSYFTRRHVTWNLYGKRRQYSQQLLTKDSLINYSLPSLNYTENFTIDMICSNFWDTQVTVSKSSCRQSVTTYIVTLLLGNGAPLESSPVPSLWNGYCRPVAKTWITVTLLVKILSDFLESIYDFNIQLRQHSKNATSVMTA
jgi:hypothetical protein